MKTRILTLAVVASFVTLLPAAFGTGEKQPSATHSAAARVDSTAPRVDSTAARIPEGFHAAQGTFREPYTNTGWAKEVVHDRTGMEMVFIPAGEFKMGSPESGASRVYDEEPVHRVRITRPFYLGKCEVTQGEWQKVMGSNPSYFKGDRNPVETVSWTDCQQFLRNAGDGLALPTEAQWEYACRAGSTAAFSFGDITGDLGRYGWYYTNSDDRTHPVGGKEPNAWGLYDMHGNVWEWCSDWLGDTYYKSSPVDDPQGPSSGTYRVVRGGSLICVPWQCRSASRFGFDPSLTPSGFGFRVARGL